MELGDPLLKETKMGALVSESHMEKILYYIELAKQEGGYLALQRDASEVAEIIQANLGGESFDRFDLDRVKMPSGGSTVWEVPTLDGDVAVKEIEGIIISHRTTRVFWSRPMEETGGQTPPDCSSDDGSEGVGEPGGDCGRCQFNVFGTAEKGSGKACKEVKVIFLLMPGELLPLVIGITPGSLKSMKNYLFKLARAGHPYYTVTTRFSLEKAQNKEGIQFAKAHLSLGRRLEEDELDGVRNYMQNIRPVITQRVELNREELHGDA